MGSGRIKPRRSGRVGSVPIKRYSRQRVRSGRVGSGRVDRSGRVGTVRVTRPDRVTQPDPRDFENLLTRPDPSRPKKFLTQPVGPAMIREETWFLQWATGYDENMILQRLWEESMTEYLGFWRWVTFAVNKKRAIRGKARERYLVRGKKRLGCGVGVFVLAADSGYLKTRFRTSGDDLLAF